MGERKTSGKGYTGGEEALALKTLLKKKNVRSVYN